MLEQGRGWNGELYPQLLLSGKSNAMTTMRAIRVSSFGGPEVLKLLADVPVPSVSNGQVSFLYQQYPLFGMAKFSVTVCIQLSISVSEFMFLC